MNRGEVWTIGDSKTRWRVVVLSSDDYNSAGWAYCVPIVRRPTGDLPPYAVPLAEPDPMSGIALTSTIEHIPAPAGLDRVGMLTGATLARIENTLRDLFEL